MKRTFLISLFLLIFSGIYAEEGILFVSAPKSVVVGEMFDVTYTLKEKNAGRAPALDDLDWLEIVYGPTVSQSTNNSVINGKHSVSHSTIYRWKMKAKVTGTFSIPEVSITTENGNYTSNAKSIIVLPKAEGDVKASKEVNVKPDDVFVRIKLSKSSVYENENVLATISLYSRLSISNVENVKFPDFKGFFIEQIELPDGRTLTTERYNGVNYYMVNFAQYNLFPLQTGDIEIEAGTYDLKVMVEDPTAQVSTFFGSHNVKVEKTISLKSPAISLKVKPLPTDSTSLFKGTVGDYKLTASIDTTTIMQGDSVKIRLDISGKGNIRLVEAPEITPSDNFKVERTKVDVISKNEDAGVSGTKTIEYTIIPTNSGDLMIHLPGLVYFDPQSSTYKRTDDKEFKLAVSYFAPSTNEKENVEESAEERDILEKEIIPDIVFAFDVSLSMLAEDFKPNRQEAAKEFMTSVSEQIGDKNLGLVLFGAEGVVECPLTANSTQFQQAITLIDSCKIDRGGTAIGTGLALSVNMFGQNTNSAKHIVLITDGSNNLGMISPHTAGEIAQLYNVTIHIIGIGDTKAAKYPIKTSKGTEYQDILPDIDEKLLTGIASATGGKYYRATNNDSLNEICKKIAADLTEKQNKQSSLVSKNGLSKERAMQILEAISVE